ncbi:MAG: NAD(P)-dependent glycerol-1-phosphate dehydrogenase [Candidatus Methanomethyliaceae archaeon]|nr:NAD(P)-dependent glycerol-1-phosphate dehydrogenase [Candidatus Methanomethyliaceae archaeon]
MQIHAINLPRFVIVGSEVLGKVGEILKKLNYEGEILIACGEGITKGVAERIEINLDKRIYSVHKVIVKDSTYEEVDMVSRAIDEIKAKIVIGVGGGKTIDVAKLASFNRGVQFISIPTSATHDGISSPVASLKGEKGSISIMAHPPIALIADMELIINSPRRHIISGVGDIIAKFTAVRDWSLAHRLKGEYYGEHAASLALMSAKLVAKNSELIARGLEAGIRVLVEALISCGYAMCIAGSSRPCSGSEHLFAHALERIIGNRTYHGERCGIGTIMMMYLHGGNWKKVKEVLVKVGAPTTAKELGVEDEKIIEALTIAHTIRPERYTILGERGLTRDAAIEVARITGVID